MSDFLTVTNLAYLAVTLALAILVVYYIRKGKAQPKDADEPQKLAYPKGKEPKPEPTPQQTIEQEPEPNHPEWLKQAFNNPAGFEEFLSMLVKTGHISGELTTKIKKQKAYGQPFDGTLTLHLGNNGHQKEPETPEYTEEEITSMEEQDRKNMKDWLDKVKPKKNGDNKPTEEKDDIPEEYPDGGWSLNQQKENKPNGNPKK